MNARLRVPTYLQASTDVGGPERVEWLAGLPDRVEELTERWGLSLGEPFEPGGNCSWVAPGTDSNGRDVVLKVAWKHTEARHEAEGLAALSGTRAVEVYAFEHVGPASPGGEPDGDTTAMLLEPCRPGAELRGRPEAEQHVVVTDMLRSIRAVNLPSDHPFRPLSVMADEWVSQAEAWLAENPGRLDAGLARDGLSLFRELSRTGPQDVLLVTDLHAGNVLSAARSRAHWCCRCGGRSGHGLRSGQHLLATCAADLPPPARRSDGWTDWHRVASTASVVSAAVSLALLVTLMVSAKGVVQRKIAGHGRSDRLGSGGCPDRAHQALRGVGPAGPEVRDRGRRCRWILDCSFRRRRSVHSPGEQRGLPGEYGAGPIAHLAAPVIGAIAFLLLGVLVSRATEGQEAGEAPPST